MGPVPVGIIHASPLIRDAVAGLLGQRPGVRVVATFGSGREALTAPIAEKHVLLYDLATHKADGRAVLAALRQRVPGGKILIWGVADDDQAIVECVHAGAAGCVLQGGSAEAQPPQPSGRHPDVSGRQALSPVRSSPRPEWCLKRTQVHQEATSVAAPCGSRVRCPGLAQARSRSIGLQRIDNGGGGSGIPAAAPQATVGRSFPERRPRRPGLDCSFPRDLPIRS
ncbi:MAG: response regulator transcription factor [Armatimonadota bacterium]|nr:response regulator transcription factor [Armatimonadota bacterium]